MRWEFWTYCKDVSCFCSICNQRWFIADCWRWTDEWDGDMIIEVCPDCFESIFKAYDYVYNGRINGKSTR
jgi:hypothetical protein